MRKEYGYPAYMLTRDDVRHESGSRDSSVELAAKFRSIHPLNVCGIRFAVSQGRAFGSFKTVS